MTLPRCAAASCASPKRALSPEALSTIRHGGVHVEPNRLPAPLGARARRHAAPGLTRAAFGSRPTRVTNRGQGARARARRQDRQSTFRGALLDRRRARRGWPRARARVRGAVQDACTNVGRLGRPSALVRMTYNWYEPGAALGHHLDGLRGLPDCGARRHAHGSRSHAMAQCSSSTRGTPPPHELCLPRHSRRAPRASPVGADRGNLQERVARRRARLPRHGGDGRRRALPAVRRRRSAPTRRVSKPATLARRCRARAAPRSSGSIGAAPKTGTRRGAGAPRSKIAPRLEANFSPTHRGPRHDWLAGDRVAALSAHRLVPRRRSPLLRPRRA